MIETPYYEVFRENPNGEDIFVIRTPDLKEAKEIVRDKVRKTIVVSISQTDLRVWTPIIEHTAFYFKRIG